MRSRSFSMKFAPFWMNWTIKKTSISKVLFLDATDSELVARYKETRRSHPLAADGRVLDGITLERELLSPLKNISQNVVDTTELTPRNLRKRSQNNLPVKIISQIFGLRSCHLVLNMAFRSMLTLSLTCVSFKPLLQIGTSEFDRSGIQQSMIMSWITLNQRTFTVISMTWSPILPSINGKVNCSHHRYGLYRWATPFSSFAERLAHDLEKNWQVNCSHRRQGQTEETVNRSWEPKVAVIGGDGFCYSR